MKNIKNIWGMALVAFMLIVSAPHKTMAQEGEYISDQEFYDELQPYGTWIYDPQYGNVWIPDVEEDFRPYATRGYWAMTSYGNTWVSDYDWGWATFHYGRWHFDNYYGWEWIPGNEWAPAWVSWRNGGGYYGWAPMEPGISIEASFADNYSVPDNYWVFAPYAYINYTNVYNYYVPHSRVSNIIRNTSWIRNRYTYNNHTYITGPHRDEIQRYTHRPVRVYNITNVNRPSRITVNNSNINIYRPVVRQNANARPARVVDGAAYKEQNPAQRIGIRDRQRGTAYNAANAAKLAAAARTTNPDTKVVRVNNSTDRRPDNNPANTARPTRPDAANKINTSTSPGRTSKPVVTGDARQQQRTIDRQQSAEQIKQQRVQQQQAREQQRQVRVQQQNAQQQTAQQKQQLEQQRAQQKQQLEQQRVQQQQAREQQKQAREQQRANKPAVTTNDAQQQRQQAEQQRAQQQQAREQQRQQQQQAQAQQRQQADQQRAQQQQQAQEQQRQQADQQRQQQQQAREQQRQQADQQRQAREQQRQQQQQQRPAATSGRPVRQ